MFSQMFYKVVHLLGIVTLFTAMGGSVLHALNGGTRQTNAARGLVAALHGIALLLILVGGFGMMARMGMMGSGWPGWVDAKVTIWLLLPILGVIGARKPEYSRLTLVLMPMIGGLAAWIAIYKPF
jgi:hypothetical protein